MTIYSTKELKMNFLLIVPNPLEPKVNVLRERNLKLIAYDVVYRVLKTHELEIIQKRSIKLIKET